MSEKSRAREYVESYIKEKGTNAEEYLAEHQQKYDADKIPSMHGPDPSNDQQEAKADPSNTRHRPTINPIPNDQQQQTEEQQDIIWIMRDSAMQRREIHDAALTNCADLHGELLACYKDGSWWDKAKMCESQKRKFWACFHVQKKFLKEANYKGSANTPELDSRILLDAMKLQKDSEQ